MKLPSNDYILFGCDIMPIKPESIIMIQGEERNYVNKFGNLTTTNCQLLPNGYLIANSQEDIPQHVYFNDVKVIDQNQKKILGFPTPKLSHECIYGSNSPRYYTPDFDYDTLNTNILCIQGDTINNSAISPKEDIIDNFVNEYDKEGNLIWSWSASEHFDQFNLTEEEISDIHNNPIHIEPFGEEHDWIHLNSACSVGDNRWYDAGDNRFNPENIICCSRNLSMIFIIEKSTGNIVYTLKGNDFDFKFQHYGHVIPKGLSGEGNILLLDSFNEQVERKAKIMEINPITKEVVFEYKGDFVSNAMGSVQKLPDGCYLISACHSKKILVVNPEGVIVSTIDTDYLFYRVNAYPATWIEV